MNRNITLSIDDATVSVGKGATVLQAAAATGARIPTLCHLDGLPPFTSCMLCLVEDGAGRLIPSCSTPAQDGMSVKTDTDDVRAARRGALELLLSEHVGDCEGPCRRFCPAGMNIPLMIRQIAADDLAGALVTVKEHIPLPAVLGRICPAPCEKGCRRSDVDQAVSVCLLKRFVADTDLFADAPWVPARAPTTGRHVAVVGAGPAGLAAAYYLLLAGHACTLYDERAEAGGMLRYGVDPELLPRDVLDREINILRILDAGLVTDTRIGRDMDLAALRAGHDAVILATGADILVQADALAVDTTARGVHVDPHSQVVAADGVFACGAAVHPSHMAVRTVADGRRTALRVDRLLSGVPLDDPPCFDCKIQDVSTEEVEALAEQASAADRVEPEAAKGAGLSAEEAATEAARCLACDCAKADACLLRDFSARYDAQPHRYSSSERVPLNRITQHANVVYEPGKCIKCGICVRITEKASEPLGLTFIGRGLDVRIGVPFNRSLQEGLLKTATECVAKCPTGALAHPRAGIPRRGAEDTSSSDDGGSLK